MGKVKVSPEVAEALKLARETNNSLGELIGKLTSSNYEEGLRVLCEVPFMTVMRALTDGYEVEQTSKLAPEKALEEIVAIADGVREFNYPCEKIYTIACNSLGVSE